MVSPSTLGQLKQWWIPICCVFVIAYALIVWRFWNISIDDGGFARSAARGDSVSERDTRSAALYFVDFGFLKAKLLSVHQYKGDGKTEGTSTYMHYPPLPDILTAVYVLVLGSREERSLRVVPLLLSLCWFALIFYTLAVVLPDKKIAVLSASLLVLSNYFVAWADNLHQGVYAELIKWLFFLLLYRLHTGGEKRGLLLGSLAVLAFVGSLITLETIPFLAVLTVGFSWIYQRKLFSSSNCLVAGALFLGMALHFLQVAWFYGSFQGAYEDFRYSLHVRSVSGGMNLRKFLELPLKFLNRGERFFMVPGFAMLILYPLAYKRMRLSAPPLHKLSLLTLAAGGIWYLLVPQHATEHVFIGRHLALFYGLSLGYGLSEFAKRGSGFVRERRWAMIALSALFSLYIVAMAVTQQVLDIYLRFGFLYPHLGSGPTTQWIKF